MRVLCLFCLLCVVSFAANAERQYCVDTTYTINYTCGEGTLNTSAGATLPDPTTATYGSNVTITALTRTQSVNNTNIVRCLPPDGKEWAGAKIMLGDETKSVIVSTSPSSTFKYLYMDNITVVPNFVGVATADQLRDYTHQTVLYYTSSGRQWRAIYGFGYVQGEAACSSTLSNENRNGYHPLWITHDQEDVVDAGNVSGTLHCYCRIAEPHSDKSPWVFRWATGGYGECNSNCHYMCGDYYRVYSEYRGLLLTGVLAE